MKVLVGVLLGAAVVMAALALSPPTEGLPLILVYLSKGTMLVGSMCLVLMARDEARR
jgi:uncharacterized iron-regulated membrane protein